MATNRILIVDDEETLCEALKLNLENEGYDACLQKAIPNLRIKGDKTTNPEWNARAFWMRFMWTSSKRALLQALRPTKFW